MSRAIRRLVCWFMATFNAPPMSLITTIYESDWLQVVLYEYCVFLVVVHWGHPVMAIGDITTLFVWLLMFSAVATIIERSVNGGE